MAKMKKKISPAKNISKKPAAAKSAVKPVAKHAAAKKTAGKAVGKMSTSDAKSKKTLPKKMGKAPEKMVKKPAPAKEKAKPVVIAKKAAVAVKPEKKAAEKEKEIKKLTPEPAPIAKATPKKEAKGPAAKKAGKAKKEESQDEDDFVSDDEFVGGDDIGEYEEELKAVEELDEESLDEDAWAAENRDRGEEEVILTDAEGRRYCRSRDCDQVGVVDGYCRFHYLLFWKKIQVRKKILADGKLQRYVEELTSRYPDKFLEMIRRDLRTEKDFLAAIQELEIDESAGENEFEEDANAYLDEVRGMGEASNANVDEEDF